MAIPTFMFRAVRVDNHQWVTGYYAYKPIVNKHYIVREVIVPYSLVNFFNEIEIVPETVEFIDNDHE